MSNSTFSEHLKLLQHNEMSDHYLSKTLLNESIKLLGYHVQQIIKKVHSTRYFAVIMDCTPDISYQEQLSVNLCIVNCSVSDGTHVSEHFIRFITNDESNGKGLLEAFSFHTQKLNIDINNCRG
ncbi:uncharacterized protein LOC111085847 [Limulus polyphemus]|uniref:Uncharacterized protein LOC111085847 n=1 Tax=Limulus polyphemus TaxID=6850 RepID=A0ABM1SEH0_LIMPO|nr:uncharacterized protein LOC111085847 [Limulus polyphemus]